ncbi:uncharacterized protein LOC129939478 [Eupeodes corollae]|uniref:uncharacterized protein LOC129939478 n=1 Tax=Eupeodes corollae TaxID=290404 RepID=UPI00248FE925|nr:uncharacterized protein LOC129939478 [Eupeodes corollae]
MESYRVINHELSRNNQELRTAIQKYKHEIIYLNRKLLEQREEFNRLKASIAKTIEEKYTETMDFIFPERIAVPDQIQNSKLSLDSHRRSSSNLKEVDPVKRKSHSARIGSSCGLEMEESTFKMPSPRIVDEGIVRSSKPIPTYIQNSSSQNESKDSPSFKEKNVPRITVEAYQTLSECQQNVSNQSESRKSEDLHTSKSSIEESNASEMTEMGQTLKTPNTSLGTINEEKSCASNAPNETLSDATINCLLDAPCSTPYNQHKAQNGTIFQRKEVRVLVKKMSIDELAHLSIQDSHCTGLSDTLLKNTTFKSKSAQIEACHSEKKCSQFTFSNFTINNSTCKVNINSSSDVESFAGPKTIPTKEKVTPSNNKSIKVPISRERIKGKQNKENQDTDSEFTCSDEESNVGRRRLRHKQLSLKEPSLRAKLRNTTNIKF